MGDGLPQHRHVCGLFLLPETGLAANAPGLPTRP